MDMTHKPLTVAERADHELAQMDHKGEFAHLVRRLMRLRTWVGPADEEARQIIYHQLVKIAQDKSEKTGDRIAAAQAMLLAEQREVAQIEACAKLLEKSILLAGSVEVETHTVTKDAGGQQQVSTFQRVLGNTAEILRPLAEGRAIRPEAWSLDTTDAKHDPGDAPGSNGTSGGRPPTDPTDHP